tara:strand:- start:4091 stop:4951 length:861 start_codon:yes stop_codon:yes gene_type:complete
MNHAWLYESTDQGARALPLDASAPGDPLDAAYASMPHGVYEGLRTHDGVRLFALDRHLERAAKGSKVRGLPPWDQLQLRRALDQALREHEGDLRVRIDFLPSPAVSLGGTGTVLLGLRPLVLPPPEAYELGVGVQPLRDLERKDPEVKGAAFATERIAHEWDPRDNYEPMLTSGSGELLEGVSSNFIAIQGQVLRSAGGGVLPGITRQVVFELAAELGMEVQERAVGLAEVGELDEACLTSSVRGIVPIVRIANQSVGNGRPGPRVTELRDLLTRRILAEARPPLA